MSDDADRDVNAEMIERLRTRSIEERLTTAAIMLDAWFEPNLFCLLIFPLDSKGDVELSTNALPEHVTFFLAQALAAASAQERDRRLARLAREGQDHDLGTGRKGDRDDHDRGGEPGADGPARGAAAGRDRGQA